VQELKVVISEEVAARDTKLSSNNPRNKNTDDAFSDDVEKKLTEIKRRHGRARAAQAKPETG